MKYLRPCLLGMAVGLLPLASGSTAVDEVRATDAAFAARAGAIGHHAAFIEYLASDAVLFRPEAVQGQEWLATHEPAGGQLDWSPSAAAVDCTGRLAVTSGPWRYANADGGQPVAGHYLSVWRLDADAEWRVVLDHGIDDAAGAAATVGLQDAVTRLWPADAAPRCKGRSEAADLAKAEQKLNEQVSRQGLHAALQDGSAPGVLVYRDDYPPGPLLAALVAADAAFGRGTLARSVGTVFEPGTDLAVTHGVLQSADGSHHSLYVRVWSRERRRWQVAIDLRTPLPLP
jgi:ketosteroid isomerase-like protein